MPLYDKPVRVLMKEMAAAFAKAPDSAFTRQEAVDWFAQHYPKVKVGTVAAHLIRLSTNAKSRIHYNPKPGDDDVFYQIDGNTFRHYRPGHDPSPLKSGLPKSNDDTSPPPEPPDADGQFAYESDLRNYLSKNLRKLEAGLRLYSEEGIKGIEFPVGGRFIDILATDADGGLVVIELKVSRGYDRVVGQLMRYIAWIKKNLADLDQNVRGLIVAREISEDLKLACSLVPTVELFEYEMSLSVKRVMDAST